MNNKFTVASLVLASLFTLPMAQATKISTAGDHALDYENDDIKPVSNQEIKYESSGTQEVAAGGVFVMRSDPSSFEVDPYKEAREECLSREDVVTTTNKQCGVGYTSGEVIITTTAKSYWEVDKCVIRESSTVSNTCSNENYKWKMVGYQCFHHSHVPVGPAVSAGSPCSEKGKIIYPKLTGSVCGTTNVFQAYKFQCQ